MAEIVLRTSVVKDEYTQYIEDNYDLKVEDVQETRIPFNFRVKMDEDWNIGVICGASGSGKSTILNQLGGGQTTTFNDGSLISNFKMMPPKEATELLCAMGLASVPTWLRPFSCLSNGEKYRATIAKIIAERNEGEVIRIDEFTSVVDRNSAKAMSNSIAKYARRHNLKIILVSCHYDILEWLNPNWTYDLNKGGVLVRGDYLRPQIELVCHRTESRAWDLFKKHHYMTSEMNEGAASYVFTWERQIVAFVSVLAQPSGTMTNAVRGSRTVVLPDFQGLGIGAKVTEFIASVYKASGYTYYTKTINPRLGEYRDRSPKWEGTAFNGKERNDSHTDKFKNTLKRKSYCHKYVGEPTYGCEELIRPIDKMRYDKSMEGQLSLF